MINQSDSIEYHTLGFNGTKYIQLQANKIKDRMKKFTGRLYLEIGGKFMYDAHASRVLPGFDPESKKKIFSSFRDDAEILFCVNADDIVNNRQLSNENISYENYVIDMLENIKKGIGIIPKIIINKVKKGKIDKIILDFEEKMKKLGYNTWRRYFILGYPNIDTVLSDKGYGQDEYIELEKNLVLVTGAASNSGKMSTCLGQIYLDNLNNISSGYAKYETFPIWNLDLNHPVNLAYEAATADIGDYNCLDTYHERAYGQKVVNYNRDVSGFKIVIGIAKKIVNHKNYIRNYQSPTDMGISMAGFAITDDEIISRASLDEIRRRKKWYKEMLDRGEGKQKWIDRCDELEKKCLEYFDKKKYIL